MIFHENIAKQIKQYEEENGALPQRINSLNSTDQNYFPNIIPIKRIPASEEVWEKCKSWDSFWSMWIIDRYKSADEYNRGISYEFIQQHFNSTSKFSPLGILSL